MYHWNVERSIPVYHFKCNQTEWSEVNTNKRVHAETIDIVQRYIYTVRVVNIVSVQFSFLLIEWE